MRGCGGAGAEGAEVRRLVRRLIESQPAGTIVAGLKAIMTRVDGARFYG